MLLFKYRRLTLESDIEIKINFLGNSFFKIKTSIFFLDHLISQFVNYSIFDCYLRCYSDLKIDTHHSIEDIGITFGLILKKFIFNRFNSFLLCMDDTIILINLDICNRYYYYDNFLINDYDLLLVKEFLLSFVRKFNCNMHLYTLNYTNKHHLLESVFKILGSVLNKAKNKNNHISTKGIL